MFFRPPFLLPLIYPKLIWRMSVGEKKVYLTFDDGPVPGPTEFVLDVLDQNKIKATFFVIGDNVRKHPAIFRKVVDGGHAIGNHTYNHLKGWSCSVNEYLENISQCQQLITSDTSITTSKLFRPPYGRITKQQIKSLNYHKIIMWDVLTQDYSSSLSQERCLQGSIKATRPGSIVVFHDSKKAERNLTYVLPRFIETMLSKGYSFDVIK